jgi:hypothetical protein
MPAAARETSPLREVARCIAILKAIDRDLDERGLVDKGGKPRYLLYHRSRLSRQLEQWLAKISQVIERQTPTEEEPPLVKHDDYVRELQRIALGKDPSASTRDRLTALKELLKYDKASDASQQVVQVMISRDEDGSNTVRSWRSQQTSRARQRMPSNRGRRAGRRSPSGGR